MAQPDEDLPRSLPASYTVKPCETRTTQLASAAAPTHKKDLLIAPGTDEFEDSVIQLLTKIEDQVAELQKLNYRINATIFGANKTRKHIRAMVIKLKDSKKFQSVDVDLSSKPPFDPHYITITRNAYNHKALMMESIKHRDQLIFELTERFNKEEWIYSELLSALSQLDQIYASEHNQTPRPIIAPAGTTTSVPCVITIKSERPSPVQEEVKQEEFVFSAHMLDD